MWSVRYFMFLVDLIVTPDCVSPFIDLSVNQAQEKTATDDRPDGSILSDAQAHPGFVLFAFMHLFISGKPCRLSVSHDKQKHVCQSPL
jgi:hypothetical protein